MKEIKYRVNLEVNRVFEYNSMSEMSEHSLIMKQKGYRNGKTTHTSNKWYRNYVKHVPCDANRKWE